MCKKYKIPAFLLALDQAKAFDSVRHDYMRQCFEFFGFPNNFVRLLEIFTTNRTAHIILDGGQVSESFDLEIGNAQGNGPSPLQFNICEQILFFKIELNPAIRSIFEPSITLPVSLHSSDVPAFDENQRDRYAYEKNRSTNKLEGFADDGTVLAKATAEAFYSIHLLLENFKNLSGLRCNIDKSMVVPIGFDNNVPVPDFIANSGFKVVNKVTILGTEISNNVEDLQLNFEKIIVKLHAIKNFWSRFKLSLTGRILVAKKFMLSQIGYLGSVISPTNQQIKAMKTCIEDFVKGGLNVANSRVSGNLVDRGLGMIDVGLYVTALQAAWFKKINGHNIDIWRNDLYNASCGNIFTIDPAELRKSGSVVVAGIADSFCAVRDIFLGIGNNLLESFVVNNPELKRFEANGSVLLILRNNIPRISDTEICKLKLKFFWEGGTSHL
jgi:hypothetical protein